MTMTMIRERLERFPSLCSEVLGVDNGDDQSVLGEVYMSLCSKVTMISARVLGEVHGARSF